MNIVFLNYCQNIPKKIAKVKYWDQKMQAGNNQANKSDAFTN